VRVAAAILCVASLIANVSTPSFALGSGNGTSGVDPRYLAFLKTHPCGFPKHPKSTPLPNMTNEVISAQAVIDNAGFIPNVGRRMQILVISPHAQRYADPSPAPSVPDVQNASPVPSAAASVAPDASAAPVASAAPAASAAPVTSAAPAATTSPEASFAPVTTLSSAAPGSYTSAAPESSDQSASAAPSAAPTATPVGIPRVPPGGGNDAQLVPPTPFSNASATPTPEPLPTTSPAASTGPIFLERTSPAPINAKGATPNPNASPPPKPKDRPTLSPDDVVTIADHLSGSTDQSQPSDLTGNVHIFYQEGQIVGDKAHYDGDHTIVVSGHTYLINRAQDSILYGDQIAFDTRTRRAVLLNGSGESSEAVSTGKLHYEARTLNARADGVSHGDRASFTTCENGHAGYHIEARTIDVTPSDKLVARKAVLYLGPTAILYIPVLVIPLVAAEIGQRTTSFIPLIGYDSIDGFFIKTRIGFGTTKTYYGYYRVEYFTKRGLGLGYVGYIGAADARRYTTIDAYTIKDHVLNERTTNVNIQDVETFTKRLRGQFGVTYVGDFGPGISLPASENITGSLIHTGNFSTENLTFSRYVQGNLSDNLNIGLTDSLTISQQLTQQFDFAYAKFSSALSSTDTFHIESITHYSTKAADYNLTYDKTDYSSDPFGYDRLPELQVLPHINYGNFKFGPQLQFTGGEYAEDQNHFSTSRFEGQLNEAVTEKVFGDSDFNANYNLTQYYYGTGDEKAFDQQNASLSTPIGLHLINSITYNEQHPIGPTEVPFELLDHLSSGAHSAQDVLRFYNGDVFSFSLSDGTSFDREAQGATYQLNYRPSPKSYIVIGGYFQPGPGQGFGTTNVQAITPFGKDTSLQFSTNVDWKNHNRLEDKNIYLSKTVDNCYNLLASYNQDLKAFSFSIVILAFPGQAVGFGLGGQQTSPVLPQSFAF